jgi:hypothetical protein
MESDNGLIISSINNDTINVKRIKYLYRLEHIDSHSTISLTYAILISCNERLESS